MAVSIMFLPPTVHLPVSIGLAMEKYRLTMIDIEDVLCDLDCVSPGQYFYIHTQLPLQGEQKPWCTVAHWRGVHVPLVPHQQLQAALHGVSVWAQGMRRWSKLQALPVICVMTPFSTNMPGL